MPTKRITVSVPTDVARRLKQAAGSSRSVSEWVTNAVTRSLEEEDLQRRFLDFCEAVDSTSTDDRRVRACFDQIMRKKPRVLTKGSRRRGKSAA